MLTPVWFILVAIAIPCQAYLDDRVLLDQHWTGFSPTVDGAGREDFKASVQDRRHALAQQIVQRTRQTLSRPRPAQVRGQTADGAAHALDPSKGRGDPSLSQRQREKA
ncbi:hypothetical protein HPB51_002486 [Rhipicephalus microplus]|uniref:Uncharacterized protein n=1 Tax=Rhipicephalus microplus TaxID=6941 RepID=A0A9J6DF19_RHIMP|nr:hypothetical protein HPB51_002486 [Rhipicephalus microplus]